MFVSAQIEVKAGAFVGVTNRDGVDHTFTAVDRSFDSGPLRQSQTGVVQIPTVGTFEFICSIHMHMRGTVKAS